MSTPTAETNASVTDLPLAVLNSVKQGQELFLSSLNQWSDSVGFRGQALSKVPDFVNDLPKPDVFLNNMFEFADAVLASQRELADKFFGAFPK